MTFLRPLATTIVVLTAGVRATSAPAGNPAQYGNLGYVTVTPHGPEDGGQFGPETPGTKTSGLQEAFNQAKATGRDMYIVGGSWTAGKTEPIVYFLHETLHVPWMQDFRLDSGNAVIQYVNKHGDAVVFDSQMSCHYRWGLLASNADGAVVRLRPGTAGPDRFRVITTTEFTFNAIVGGGGAWPGGAAHQTKLDPRHAWLGTGLALDGSHGSINDNKILVMEVVGCNVGVHLTGNCTNNWIDAPLLHLCNTHVRVGDGDGGHVHNNRIRATMNSQGIGGSVGAQLFGCDNLLTLSAEGMSRGRDVVFEKTARHNLVVGAQLANGMTNRAAEATNRVFLAGSHGFAVATPPVPASGMAAVNRNLFPVAVLIVRPGRVSSWTLTDAAGKSQSFAAPLAAGQSIRLEPGNRLTLTYAQAPTWRWQGNN